MGDRPRRIRRCPHIRIFLKQNPSSSALGGIPNSDPVLWEISGTSGCLMLSVGTVTTRGRRRCSRSFCGVAVMEGLGQGLRGKESIRLIGRWPSLAISAIVHGTMPGVAEEPSGGDDCSRSFLSRFGWVGVVGSQRQHPHEGHRVGGGTAGVSQPSAKQSIDNVHAVPKLILPSRAAERGE